MIARTKLAKLVALCALTVTAGASSQAYAQDFFSFFRGFGGRSTSEGSAPMPYADERARGGNYDRGSDGRNRTLFFPEFGQGDARQSRAQSYSGGGGQAYCVRTCDGRAFPIAATGDLSKAETCKSFCPASETKVAYGSSLDNASLENGRPYSSLPNAFKFRNELVAGCTCNGKDQFGLASIKIEKDPTLRKGDIVAGIDGLMVSKGGADRRGASLEFSPVSASIKAKYARLPIVAAE